MEQLGPEPPRRRSVPSVQRVCVATAPFGPPNDTLHESFMLADEDASGPELAGFASLGCLPQVKRFVASPRPFWILLGLRPNCGRCGPSRRAEHTGIPPQAEDILAYQQVRDQCKHAAPTSVHQAGGLDAEEALRINTAKATVNKPLPAVSAPENIRQSPKVRLKVGPILENRVCRVAQVIHDM